MALGFVMSLTWQPLLAWHDLGLSHGVAPQADLSGWDCEERGNGFWSALLQKLPG